MIGNGLALQHEPTHVLRLRRPSLFYNRYNLNATYIIHGPGPVIYAANFFEPKDWLTSNPKAACTTCAYGGTFPCTEVTYKPLVKERCGGFDSKKQVLVDRAWVSKELDVISKFSAENNVPVWIDQWGLQAGAVGGDAVHDQYLDDILSEFDFRGFHWSYWIWRRDNNWATDGYAIERQNANGTYEPFQLALKHLGRYLD